MYSKNYIRKRYWKGGGEYINFINFEKAFDSIDREVIWIILYQFGIPDKYIRVIRILWEFNSMSGTRWTTFSETKHRVRSETRVHILADTAYNSDLLDNDEHRRQDKNTGITWNMFDKLEDLKFTGNKQEKTLRLAEVARNVGLQIY